MKKVCLNNAEKVELMQIVIYLLELAVLARQNGFNSIEKKVEESKDVFFTFAYKLSMHGYDPALRNKILYNLINSVELTNIEYMSKMMQIDILNIIGEQPNYMINIILFSYFGFDFENQYQVILKKSLSENVYRNFYNDADNMIF